MAFIFDSRRKPPLHWWFNLLVLSFCVAHACAAGAGQTNNHPRACKRNPPDPIDRSAIPMGGVARSGHAGARGRKHDSEVVAVGQRLLAKHDVGKDSNWRHLWKRTDDGYIAYEVSTYESQTSLKCTPENLAAVRAYVYTLWSPGFRPTVTMKAKRAGASVTLKFEEIRTQDVYPDSSTADQSSDADAGQSHPSTPREPSPPSTSGHFHDEQPSSLAEHLKEQSRLQAELRKVGEKIRAATDTSVKKVNNRYPCQQCLRVVCGVRVSEVHLQLARYLFGQATIDTILRALTTIPRPPRGTRAEDADLAHEPGSEASSAKRQKKAQAQGFQVRWGNPLAPKLECDTCVGGQNRTTPVFTPPDASFCFLCLCKRLTPRAPQNVNRHVRWCPECASKTNESGDGTHAVYNSLVPLQELFGYRTDDGTDVTICGPFYEYSFRGGCLSDASSFSVDILIAMELKKGDHHRKLWIPIEIDGESGHTGPSDVAKDTISTFCAMEHFSGMNRTDKQCLHKCVHVRVNISQKVKHIENGDRAYCIRQWVIDAMLRFMDEFAKVQTRAAASQRVPLFYCLSWQKTLPAIFSDHGLGSEIKDVPAPDQPGSWAPHPTALLHRLTTGEGSACGRYQRAPNDEAPCAYVEEISPLRYANTVWKAISCDALDRVLALWKDHAKGTTIRNHWCASNGPLFMKPAPSKW